MGFISTNIRSSDIKNESRTSCCSDLTETLLVCRSCGKFNLITILSLGRTPLANSLLTAEQLDQPEPTYPLDLVHCKDCGLVQITETVPPEKLFREYFYRSSFSDTTLQQSEEIANLMIASRGLGEGSLVAEIASNDGYLLQYYCRKGIPVLGIEPALKIARVAQERGIRTISEFFGERLGLELSKRGEWADVIHANNVLAHVSDLNGFTLGIRHLLKEDGLAVIEVPYVRDLIEHCEFDTIYHEHLSYFSLTALDRLFSRNGLTILDLERIPIHGGSIRIFAGRDDQRGGTARSLRVDQLLEEEAGLGMGQIDFYRDFGLKVERLRDDLLELVQRLKAQGRRIAVYGASAKGSTLLNYFGIDGKTLDFVVDRSTVKQGHYTPGTHLPIYAPEKLLQASPDYVLLLTWNFVDEILAQQSEYRRRGGRFIIPIPELKIV